MIRVVGVDPGTRSFDIVVVEGGVVRVEYSYETTLVAREPQVLIDAIDGLDPDYVVAPSGYGVPPTSGDDIMDARRFAVEVLLLSTEDDLREGVEVGEVGIWVYDALAKIVVRLVERYGGRVLFLPAVIHLPTVPWYRKLNKIDMGTVDKLASTFLAVHEMIERYGYDAEGVNVVVVELGYGYTACIAVKGGLVVDGIGGTSSSTGTLTAGALDLELVAGSRRWSRWDVFHGGLFHTVKIYDLNDIMRCYEQGDERCVAIFNAYVEGVAKDIMRALTSTPKADTVILTGRYSRVKTLVDHLREIVKDVEFTTLKGLKGSSRSKEAAQGYTAMGEGLVGGVFNYLVKHMRIGDACGTSVDYITHPRAQEFTSRVKRAYLETVKKPKLCEKTHGIPA